MPPVGKKIHSLLADRFSALGRLFEQHFKGAPKAPAISTTTAVTLSVAFTIIYVVPFYLSSATRPSVTLSRDAPSSIRARVRAVTLSSIISLALTTYVLHQSGDVSPAGILHLLGLWPISVLDIVKTNLLVAILFAGPLFEQGIVDGGWRDWIRFRGLHETLSSWIGYRNFVVGPTSEELIWRGMIIPLHILAQISGTKIIFLTPLYFGIAHVHHLYEFRLTHPETPLALAVFRSLFQFTYTSLFGFFAAFAFIRTGNVFSLILTHAFCNWMGLPRFWGRVGVESGVPIGPPDADKRDDDQGTYGRASSSIQSAGLAWTVAYYVILIAGAYGFYRGLFPLTESINALPVVLVES
ncbi:CaaX prenyl proteinase Rce1 [Aaosphaeria arxii CBS 175.79]|uniref:intramembrane prenyl-peptidase Rce1 n=1 Tax=Aaosphaeria arxii CBS 175.79 TaxID=1450172 RepID=A0A6A5XUY2_9PLEO|nr:CaaX prenyl proteinase Rce1 [Aaosphaeria arxii CBS 175.79]KAF2016440.1 CaaX prenyl proteinase Rce1 [Aaosphaeria arxii CBS 175.79]